MESFRNFNHSRAKAIREHCLECSGFDRRLRTQCPAIGCALWAFRLGYEVDENGARIIHPKRKQNDMVNEIEVEIEDEMEDEECEF